MSTVEDIFRGKEERRAAEAARLKALSFEEKIALVEKWNRATREVLEDNERRKLEEHPELIGVPFEVDEPPMCAFLDGNHAAGYYRRRFADPDTDDSTEGLFLCAEHLKNQVVTASTEDEVVMFDERGTKKAERNEQ